MSTQCGPAPLGTPAAATRASVRLPPGWRVTASRGRRLKASIRRDQTQSPYRALLAPGGSPRISASARQAVNEVIDAELERFVGRIHQVHALPRPFHVVADIHVVVDDHFQPLGRVVEIMDAE